MTDLAERLDGLGLAQYLDAFVAEGFDSWETVLDITESDLNSLNVKLGHRRKLQRAVADFRGLSNDRPLSIALSKAGSVDGYYRSGDDSAPENKVKRLGDPSVLPGASQSTKRKYRRHPKPDENAPERPPSAYVIFSNQVRESLKGQDLNFTEIAKVVGERWQQLSPTERDRFELEANTNKEKYYTELTEYKKTPQYETYQKYLEEFKAKHAVPPKDSEGKRSKRDIVTANPSTRSSSHEVIDRTAGRRVSLAQSEVLSIAAPRAESSPPMGSSFPGYPYAGKPTSPATHSMSAFNSPRLGEHYSPLSASPRSAILHKEASFETYPSPLARDPAERPLEASMSIPPAFYGYPSTAPSHIPPTLPQGAHYQSPIEFRSRRPYRETERLPPLSHEDTTLSSDSGHGPAPPPLLVPSVLPVVDGPKALRLPQPVPSIGPAAHLDRPPPHLSTYAPAEHQASSSLAALAQAGEWASAADYKPPNKESLP